MTGLPMKDKKPLADYISMNQYRSTGISLSIRASPSLLKDQAEESYCRATKSLRAQTKGQPSCAPTKKRKNKAPAAQIQQGKIMVKKKSSAAESGTKLRKRPGPAKVFLRKKRGMAGGSFAKKVHDLCDLSKKGKQNESNPRRQP